MEVWFAGVANKEMPEDGVLDVNRQKKVCLDVHHSVDVVDRNVVSLWAGAEAISAAATSALDDAQESNCTVLVTMSAGGVIPSRACGTPND